MVSPDEDWYRSPLYYDIIFDQDTAEEADFVEAVSEEYGAGRDRPWRVLEPACGSGRMMVELAKRGHSVAGFDIEPAMVSFATERLAEAGLAGRVEKGRMERFEIGGGPYDLAHCFVSTFKYVLTERGARSHLRHVAKHLRKGGIYLLGFHLSKYDGEKPVTERWKGKRGSVNVHCVIESEPPDPATRLESVRSTLKIREGERKKTLVSDWDFRTYDAAQAKAMLRAVPELSLVACYDFRYDLDAERELDDSWEDVILVLKKR